MDCPDGFGSNLDISRLITRTRQSESHHQCKLEFVTLACRIGPLLVAPRLLRRQWARLTSVVDETITAAMIQIRSYVVLDAWTTLPLRLSAEARVRRIVDTLQTSSHSSGIQEHSFQTSIRYSYRPSATCLYQDERKTRQCQLWQRRLGPSLPRMAPLSVVMMRCLCLWARSPN